jgi:hypothetical protein
MSKAFMHDDGLETIICPAQGKQELMEQSRTLSVWKTRMPCGKLFGEEEKPYCRDYSKCPIYRKWLEDNKNSHV